MELALGGDERTVCVIGSHSTQSCNSLIVNWAHDQGGDWVCVCIFHFRRSIRPAST